MKDCQCCVQDVVARADLDYSIKWHHQPNEQIAKVIGVVYHDFIYFLFTCDADFQAQEHHDYFK
jgi:hypothetical protein